MQCPSCGSERTVSNGSVRGRSKRACKDCRRQFTPDAKKKVISDETKALIQKLLKERISLRGIARCTDVSFSWLQNYVNELYAKVPREVQVKAKKKDD